MAEELGMGATDTGVARLVRLYMADIKVFVVVGRLCTWRVCTKESTVCKYVMFDGLVWFLLLLL